jgi:hypothetical protein
MFQELYHLIQDCAEEKIKSNPIIPPAKRGAVIAEATTGIIHVLSQINSSGEYLLLPSVFSDSRFTEMAANQLKWRMMIHLGFSSEEANKLIPELLYLIQGELKKPFVQLVTPS